MVAYRVLYLASLVTFSFGALTFFALIVLYARERAVRTRRPVSGLPAFTLICGLSFVINLALQIASAAGAGTRPVAELSLALDIVTSLIPPCMFHLIYAPEARYLPAASVWRWLLYLSYPVSLAVGIAKGASDAGIFSDLDGLDAAPAIALGTAALLAFAVQLRSHRNLTTVERHHRWWIRTILACMAGFAATYMVRPNLFVGLLPDYLVLALFAVTLYYEKRPVFFDLLIKRGAMFAIALAGVTAIAMAGLPLLQRAALDWTAPVVCAVVLAPFWLAAPYVYRALDRFIDRAWLGRPYSIDEAERQFALDIQRAATEDDLLRDAAQSLGSIFQAPVEIRFGDAVHDGAMTANLDQNGTALGRISVALRGDGAPFMSDDHRLLRSVARTLASALQNLRLRGREQELRLLASRAELKALRAQINPHFLFNALNSIAGLIEEDSRRADETIERLAQVFRYALRKPESEWVPLAEELAFVEAYLSVEQARFGARLRVEFQIDAAANSIPIPAVTIQPLIENAIRHGVSSIDGVWIIRLRVALEDEALRVEVFDNGPGFPKNYSIGAGGHGLRNVADRLAGYYHGAASLSWNCGVDGTRVRLEMPAAIHAGNP
jgi:signal transduction histidine kinase